MKNIEQFSVYTARIFEILYESFPVPSTLKEDGIISDYLMFDSHEELKKLQFKKDVAELSNKPELSDIEGVAIISPEKIECEILELKQEQNSDRDTQKKIFLGTRDFLISEGLIDKTSSNSYRLTAKSFAHLNKTFKKGQINGQESSYIATIKEIFSKTSSASEKVAIGVAVNVIPKFLGLS